MNLYYEDIEDFPLYNWRKIQEKSLIKFARKDVEKGTVKEDKKFWTIIQDSFLAEFGLTKDYQRIIELQIEIAELECDLVIEDDNFLKNRIKQLNREIDELRNQGVSNDMDDTIHYIETWRKIEVNEKTTSVRKFFKLLRTYKSEADARKKNSK
jgi:hypothetical protein